jgi:SAM-dependent methyltransferase
MNDETPLADTTNADMLAAWDGDEGAYWAAHAQTFDEGLTRLHRRFMAAAGIGARDRVLDIGCGNGQTTRDAARHAASGSVLGIDLSSRMLDVARQCANDEGVDNARFVHGDAQIYPFDDASFDVAISRMGAMFFGDPHAAWANIARAIAPGGRLALLTWQTLARNEWVLAIRTAFAAGRDLPAPPPDAPSPFSLADPDRVHMLLSKAGFADINLEPVEDAMFFGATADAAYDFISNQSFAQFMLRDLDDATRAKALAELRASVDAHTTADGVFYPAAAWAITARL